ncbi:hypothetical protein KCP77_15020 [Salmonella enterica subsp. enterica]|nr:hypothetical protein KCP77_15020 [Salmonella enterica subsp. enterica]
MSDARRKATKQALAAGDVMKSWRLPTGAGCRRGVFLTVGMRTAPRRCSRPCATKKMSSPGRLFRSVNCGSRCAHVCMCKKITVWWVETDNTGDDVYGNHCVFALKFRPFNPSHGLTIRTPNYPMNALAAAAKANLNALAGAGSAGHHYASLKDRRDSRQ